MSGNKEINRPVLLINSEERGMRMEGWRDGWKKRGGPEGGVVWRREKKMMDEDGAATGERRIKES